MTLGRICVRVARPERAWAASPAQFGGSPRPSLGAQGVPPNRPRRSAKNCSSAEEFPATTVDAPAGRPFRTCAHGPGAAELLLGRPFSAGRSCLLWYYFLGQTKPPQQEGGRPMQTPPEGLRVRGAAETPLAEVAVLASDRQPLTSPAQQAGFGFSWSGRRTGFAAALGSDRD